MRSKLLESLVKSGIETVCKECGLKETWNGKSIMLHIDHIDGNRKNNDVENLRFLCPNCHSQTETYCGRNTTDKYKNTREFRNFLESFTTKEKMTEYLGSKTYLQLCLDWGIPAPTVSRTLKGLGFEKKPTYILSSAIRKVPLPSKEELEKLVRTMPMISIGKKFGVSDNCVRKWCRKYEIPKESFFLSHNKDRIGRKSE